jgi:hypothetical protein
MQDDQPDIDHTEIVLGGFQPLRYTFLVPLKLPVDYKYRTRSICKRAGLREFGNLLVASIEDTLTLNRMASVPFSAMILGSLLLVMLEAQLDDGVPADDLWRITSIGPRLWEALVDDPPVLASVADTLGNEGFWKDYLVECARQKRRLRNAAQN